ncbi:hypothetical protein IGI37_000907 [Enterococcus sp. AZ194]|uniref:LysM peptidoglycan-binding domain-containing protein n=1 Tax=Enterococcus sp. AZ194 TaxID=2774629 RepID=UPI003F22CB9B
MKKVLLGIALFTILSLSGCSKEKVSTTTSSSQPTMNTSTTTSSQEEKETYQSILDDYTEKLKEASPKLVAEYNTEYPFIQGGTDALAKLSNDKLAKLAELSNEGVAKMAQIQLDAKDSPSTYEKWAAKLIDVYSEEGLKITGVYLTSIASDYEQSKDRFSQPINEPNQQAKAPVSSPSSEPSYSEYYEENRPDQSTVEHPTEPENKSEDGAEYTTAQAGEGPQQIANRTGVPVEKIYELNGMSAENFFLSPGDSIRIK